MNTQHGPRNPAPVLSSICYRQQFSLPIHVFCMSICLFVCLSLSYSVWLTGWLSSCLCVSCVFACLRPSRHLRTHAFDGIILFNVSHQTTTPGAITNVEVTSIDEIVNRQVIILRLMLSIMIVSIVPNIIYFYPHSLSILCVPQQWKELEGDGHILSR